MFLRGWTKDLCILQSTGQYLLQCMDYVCLIENLLNSTTSIANADKAPAFAPEPVDLTYTLQGFQGSRSARRARRHQLERGSPQRLADFYAHASGMHPVASTPKSGMECRVLVSKAWNGVPDACASKRQCFCNA